MGVTIQFIEANKMIIEQLEYFFFFINFDILLSKVILNTGLLRELVHSVNVPDKRIESTVMKVGSIGILKQIMCQNVTYFLVFVSSIINQQSY